MDEQNTQVTEEAPVSRKNDFNVYLTAGSIMAALLVSCAVYLSRPISDSIGGLMSVMYIFAGIPELFILTLIGFVFRNILASS